MYQSHCMKKSIQYITLAFKQDLVSLMRTYFSPNTFGMLNLVFAQKNKDYGAYALRRAYPTNIKHALFISFGTVALFYLLASMTWYQPINGPEIASPTQPEGRIEKKFVIIPEKMTVAVKKIAKTTIYVAPVVVPEVQVPETKPTSVTEIINSDAAVSSQTNTAGLGTKTGVITDQPGGLETSLPTTPTEPEPVAEPEIFDFVEQGAEFPGGNEALFDLIYRSLKYPEMARESSIQGKVVVQFVVEKDGSISQVKVVKDIGGGCGQEVMRVIKSFPAWSPAKQNGLKVRSRFTIPIAFKLA
jgi:periplasmic protein TonB